MKKEFLYILRMKIIETILTQIIIIKLKPIVLRLMESKILINLLTIVIIIRIKDTIPLTVLKTIVDQIITTITLDLSIRETKQRIKLKGTRNKLKEGITIEEIKRVIREEVMRIRMGKEGIMVIKRNRIISIMSIRIWWRLKSPRQRKWISISEMIQYEQHEQYDIIIDGWLDCCRS